MKIFLRAWAGVFAVGVLSVMASSPAYAEMVTASPANSIGSAASNTYEGWIVRIEYNKNSFRLLDPRGFEKKIKTKPGMIGDYRIGDHLRVEVDPERKTAYSIEKLAQ